MTRDTYDMFAPPERGRFGENESARSSRRVTGASDLLDLDCVLHHETDKAVLVSSDGSEARATWLPKSAVEIHREGKSVSATRKSGQRAVLPVVTVTCPEWMARQKGLI